jgi:syntaxin 1B/2/3
MNDLLPLLRSKGQEQGFTYIDKEQNLEKEKENIELQNFIKSTREIQSKIKILKTNNDNLRSLKSLLIQSVAAEDKSKYNMKISSIIEESANIQKEIKTTLENNFKTFIKDLDINTNLFEQEKRISRNLHGATVKNFQDVMLEFQSLESDLKSTNEGMIIRSAEIVINRQLSREEKKNIIESPEIAQKLIQEKLSGQAHSKLQNALQDLQERHDEIRKLEASILAVHALIEELAGLVRLQGEMIDNICDNISAAKDDAIKAEEDIFDSKKNMISARKKKCVILIIILIVILLSFGGIMFNIF